MKVTPSCCESAAELSGLALAGELFFDGPVIVVANEDAAAIAVEGEGDAEAAQAGFGAGGNSLGRFPRGKNWAARILPEASSCMPRAVSRGPRPSSQS